MRLSHIDNIRIVGNFHPAQTEISFEDFVGETPDEFGGIDKARIEINNLMTTYNHLVAFKNSVAKYGLTRSLVSFADHDKTLSSSIPEVPSIESLIADRSAKNSIEVVAALEAKLTTLLLFIKQSIKDKLLNLFKNGKIILSGNITKTFLKMETLHKVILDDKLVFDEKESEIKKFSSPHFDELMHAMNLMVQMSEVLINITKLKLPESKEEYSKWSENVFDKTKSINEVLYFTMNSANEFPSTNKNSIYKKKYPSETIKNLGYTGFDKFNIILSEMKKVFTTYHNFYEEMQREYDHSEPVSENADKRVLEDAALTMCDLYQSVDESMHWLLEYGVRALKAIFWCTEKKKA